MHLLFHELLTRKSKRTILHEPGVDAVVSVVINGVVTAALVGRAVVAAGVVSAAFDAGSDNLHRNEHQGEQSSVNSVQISPASPTGLHVVRTGLCSYGRGQTLHLSRAETTVPINTKF